MTIASAQRWVDAYVAAWRANDGEQIAALFTPDASYAFSPWKEPVVGVEAIVAAWLENPDPLDSWRAHYTATLACGDTAIIKGTTSYPSEQHLYANLFEVVFDGDRCMAFTEWHMRMPWDA